MKRKEKKKKHKINHDAKNKSKIIAAPTWAQTKKKKLRCLNLKQQQQKK